MVFVRLLANLILAAAFAGVGLEFFLHPERNRERQRGAFPDRWLDAPSYLWITRVGGAIAFVGAALLFVYSVYVFLRDAVGHRVTP